MRYIIIDLSSDNDLEQPNLFGGYEGEHNESILQVKLPKRMIDIECSGYRFDFQTSEDNKISSPLIPVSELNNDILSFHLTQQLTIAGKLLFNVVAILSDENTVSMISKTNTVTLRIEDAADGNIQLIDPNGYKDELQKMVDERIDEKTIVDQTYNSNSLNAQSGKAVAQALENIDVGDKVDIINRENATTDFGYTGDTLPFLYAMLKNNVQGLVKTAMGEATPLTIPVRDGNGVVEVGLNIPDEDFFSGPATPLSLLQKRFNDVNLKAITAQNQANANKSYIKEKRISSYWLTYSSTDYGTIFNESGMYFLLDITGSNTIRFCDTSKNNLKDTGNSEITNKFNVAIVIVPEGVSKNVNSFQQSDVLIMGYKKGSSILTSSIEARQVFVNSKNSGNKGSFTVYDYIQVDKSSIPKDGHLAVWKISLFDDMIPTE